MVACSSCSRSNTLCVFSAESAKCSECTRKGVSCDGNFSETDYEKLAAEKGRLKVAHRQALDRARDLGAGLQREVSEAASLDRRIEALDKAQGAMIAREARSLQELEREAQPQQASAESELVFDEQQLADLFGAPESSGGNTS
jgi:hypothetical protein